MKKYFGNDDQGIPFTEFGIAHNLICAMQEPIKKGEKVLFVSIGSIEETVNEYDDTKACWHPSTLRLPDRFQKKECRHGGCFMSCGLCGKMLIDYRKPEPEKCDHANYDYQPGLGWACNKCSYIYSKPKDEVDEKIENICHGIENVSGTFHKELRELVELARKK